MVELLLGGGEGRRKREESSLSLLDVVVVMYMYSFMLCRVVWEVTLCDFTVLPYLASVKLKKRREREEGKGSFALSLKICISYNVRQLHWLTRAQSNIIDLQVFYSLIQSPFSPPPPHSNPQTCQRGSFCSAHIE